MPKIASLGALSSRGFGEFAQSGPVTYIEDVFSTYLYTGNGTYTPKTGVNTIQNGIDLSTKGGLVWAKTRSDAGTSNVLFDTARGVSNLLITNNTDPQANYAGYGVTSFNTNGFTLEGNLFGENRNTWTEVSWTFRKQPKFFDVVTYTGTGSAGLTINHNLGSVPGMIILKATSSNPAQGQNWLVYHRTQVNCGRLNTTDSFIYGGIQNVTATSFQPLGTGDAYNVNGVSYIAYLFAHDAGGFGLDGTQNVISCGSFTCDSSGNLGSVTLGYEPQYILFKRTDTLQNWYVWDVIRGMSLTSGVSLSPNLSSAELNWGASSYVYPTATGFAGTGNFFGPNAQVIYMAIRRGPMKVPTDATKVFQPIYSSTTLANQVNGTVGPIDLTIQGQADGAFPIYWMTTFDRLRGSRYVITSGTDAETAGSVFFDTNVGVRNGAWFTNGGAVHNFARAPSFMDVVCYTGTGGLLTLNHNLGVVPELAIVKARGSNSFAASNNWYVYCQYLSGTVTNRYLNLNSTAAAATNTNVFGNTPFTSTTFGVGGIAQMDAGVGAVAYLFASCPGVSKVGTYTGTGATQTISCGFTGGARYVLIKRTDSTGDWWIWDTARGMVAGTDFRLSYNNTGAQINANWVYTTTGGFQIVTTDASVNASGGTYIFLAIA